MPTHAESYAAGSPLRLLKLTALFIIVNAASNLTFEGCTAPDKKTYTSPLECTLSVPRNVSAYAELTLRLTLVNKSVRVLDLGLQGNPPFRFTVAKESGESVWESTRGEPIQQLLELRTLAPSESLTFACEWNLTDDAGNRVPKGTYIVQGWVELDPPLTARATPGRLTID